MQQVNLSFAKIVDTPTPAAWSQAYNAGNFFVALSLSSSHEEDDIELTTIGKQVINSLEVEFFGLETKNLSTIKEAVSTSLAGIPPYITISLILAYIKEQVLYVFASGEGSILLKRNNTLGELLKWGKSDQDIISASGYIKHRDLIFLRTKQFADLIPLQELQKSLELALPSDIAETLTPHVHKAEDGGAAAIIISITGVPADQPVADVNAEDESEEEYELADTEEQPEQSSERKKLTLPVFLQQMKPPRLGNPLKIAGGNNKRMLLLLLAGIIILVLGVRVYITMQSRREQQLQKSFEVVYAEAENKYETAVGIQSITPDKAIQLFQEANKDIEDKLPEFPENSTQREKLLSLQEQIRTQVAEPIEGKTLKAEAVDPDEVPLLQAMADNKNAISVTEDKNYIYVLSDAAITSIDKTNGTEKELIKNEDDWKTAVTLGTYTGNLYVLDTQNGVIKFIVAEGGYGKADYFQGDKPDVSKAVGLAIDGSVWLVSSDGTISKYTRGEQDEFTPKGIPTLIKPVQIVTGQETEHIYVLDTGSGRIVQIQKDGAFRTSFRADILSSAKAFTVSNDERSIYVLNGDKIWKLTL